MQRSILFIAFILGCLFAEEALTLEGALTQAQKNSPKAIIINREFEIARSQAFQGYGVILPSFQAKYSDVVRKSPVAEAVELPPSYSMFADMIPAAQEETKVKTTELSATWMIFSFAGFAAVGAANNALDLADYQYKDAQEALTLEITKAYYNLQSAVYVKELTAKIAIQAEAHTREVEIMYKNNLVSRKDFLDARIRLLEAKQAAFNGTLAYTLALQSFNSLLGNKLNPTLVLATTNITLEPVPSLNIEDLTTYALKNKPGYKAFETLVRLAEADEWGTWGESLPQVFLNYTKQNNKYAEESSMAVNGDTETKMWFASWSFFSGGGANFHKMNVKKNAKEKIYAQRQLMQANIGMGVESAVNDLRVKAVNYAMALEQDALAEESLKIAEINFKEGASTSTGYNDALTQKLGAEATRIKAAFDYAYARANLNYAVGKEVQ